MNHSHMTSSIFDTFGTFIATNPWVFSFSVSGAAWVLCMAFFVHDIEKAYRQERNVNSTTVAFTVGSCIAVAWFTSLLIYSYKESLGHFAFSLLCIGFVCSLANFIAGARLAKAVKKSNEVKPEEEFDIRHVLRALNDCVKQAFGIPHFVSSGKGPLAGHTIFMNSSNGGIYGVVNHADHTIKPEAIAMGDIHLCSNQGTAAPEVLCYICGLNFDGKHYDIVMNYSNRVNPIDPKRDVDLIRVMRYKLLNVMKADSVMSKIILN